MPGFFFVVVKLKFFIYFQLKDNCCTILCWFLPYINMNQPQVYVCPLPLEPPSYIPPIPSLQVVTELWFEFPESCGKFSLTVYFTYGSIYVSMLFSPFISPCPSSPSPVSISLFSVSASPLLLSKQVHQYHLSRFHVYVLLYDIYFSLSDLLHSIIGSRFIHLISTDSNVSLFMAE